MDQSLKLLEPPPSEITPEALLLQRRQLLGAAGAAALGGLLGQPADAATPPLARLPARRNPAYVAADALTPEADVTSYNNFYEFGTDKADPARLAAALPTRPWSVVVDGMVERPRRFDLDDLLRLAPIEERIYRHRCVEGWSMVIPWLGYPLARLLDAVRPTSKARYLVFTTVLDPVHMPGQRSSVLAWPYREGLRLDEAMHPLTLLSFGLYGHVLPNQNGAPLRLVVPWKYGFKGAKSIVRISLTATQPLTSWMQAEPGWYGFYSNVNPQVSPQNWSQATERRIGLGRFGGLLQPPIPTQLFNGYAEQVAGLYRGMDLRRWF